MYTGTDCQLCQVMQQEIDIAAKSVPIELSTFNIRDDALPDVHTWRRRYQYDIPVLHLEGKGTLKRIRVRGRVEQGKLTRAGSLGRCNRDLSTQSHGKSADREVERIAGQHRGSKMTRTMPAYVCVSLYNVCEQQGCADEMGI